MNKQVQSLSIGLFIIIAVGCTTPTLNARHKHKQQSNPIPQQVDIEDELALFDTEPDLDPLDDPTITTYVQHKTFKSPEAGCSAESILKFLVPLGISDLLEQNLFCHTHQLNTRALADEPLFLPRVYAYPQDIMVGTGIFWNQTAKMNFTQSSNSIDCYLALTNPHLLEKLSQPAIQSLFKDFDLARIVTLFGTTHLEERRVGLTFHALWQSPFGDLRFFLPLYYFERNFNMKESVKAELAALTFESSPGEQERFNKNHLISDSLGFGDMRIEWQLPLVDSNTFELKSGLYTTLPTAWAFAKDIKGSTYCVDAPRPTVNLEALCQNRDVKQVTDLLFYTLDHLSANLIDAKFNTQRRHFGFGGIIQSKAMLNSLIKRPWAEHFSLHNRMCLEYLTPAWEKRFYVLKADPAEFARFDKYRTADQASDTAEQDLAFLQNRLIDVIYPYVFDTLVKPNFIFWWNAKAQYEYANMGGFLGLDFWLNGKERFGTIKGLDSVCRNLEVCNAQKPLAYQMKVIGSLFYKMEQPAYNCIISCNADKTFLSSGIGKDYNVGVQFEVSF